jgi:hypothetical protein
VERIFSELLNERFIQNIDTVDYNFHVNRRSTRGIEAGKPTREEIKAAIMKHKNNRAAGVDRIPAKILKAGPSVTADILFQLFQAIWENEKYPDEWKEGVIAKFPKMGNLKHCNRWRGIRILSVFSKKLALIILERRALMY